MKKGVKLLLGAGIAVAAAAVVAAVVLVRGRLTATTISLERTEGRVNVSDSEGRDTDASEGMKLYSGYEVKTRKESFAWITLDEVKLAKLDERSEIEIQKDGGDLEIVVTSGGLFFQVTKPLEDEETMTIRTSNMVVGIRGTCGWVRVEDDEHMEVALLEGEVSCTVRDPETKEKLKETVRAGEMARVVMEEGAACSFTKEVFRLEDIPEFVLREVEDDVPAEERPEAVTFEGHYYQLVATSMRWQEAEEYCEEQGGHLVTITSAREQEFLEMYLRGVGQPCLIGLHRDLDEFGVWVTGEKVKYTNWGTGEPDYANNNQPVGVIDPRASSGTTSGRPDHSYAIEPFQWDDIDDRSFWFVCEWDE